MPRSKSVILAYHSVSHAGSVIATPPELFEAQMECLVSVRVPVVPLESISRADGAVALTFDDGYCDFLDKALPVLLRFKLPATVFVVAGRCGGRNDWDQAGYGPIPSLPLMDWDQIREAARAGIEIGAHTYSHPDLRRLRPEDVAGEFARCQAEIRAHTGQTVHALAYPYGRSTAAVRGIARRHFRLACGAKLDFVRPGADLLDLPRVDVYYLRDLKRFREVVLGKDLYLRARRALRTVRQAFRG
jgi:peptidoglycan/xylan/chitin deacetylase (PgdA/CDA1 family)